MFFTILDIRGVYNLICIKKGKEQKTAFKTCYSYYKYLVMLFRLTNALATCQVLINNVLRVYLDITVVAYLNNILVYSKTLEEHITYIQEVLIYLKATNLRLKLEKCEQHKEEVEFLGYIVRRHRVKISSTKIDVVKNQSTLTTVKGI